MEICSLLPAEALRGKAIAPSFVLDARLHQSLQELAAASLICLPHAREAEKTFPIYH